MLSTLLVGLAIAIIIMNFYYFLTKQKYKKSYFQSSLFQKLFFIMLSLTIGFAVLYYLLSLESTVLRVGTEEGEEGGESFLDYLYFSGVTILSVGYGDLVPIGTARFFALIQAGLGFLLPTAFFIRALSEKEDSSRKGERGQEQERQNNGKEGQGNRSDKRGKNDEDDRKNEEADK